MNGYDFSFDRMTGENRESLGYTLRVLVTSYQLPWQRTTLRES